MLLATCECSCAIDGLSKVSGACQVKAARDEAAAMLGHAKQPAGMGGSDAHRWTDSTARGDCRFWLRPRIAANFPALQTCIDAMMQLQAGDVLCPAVTAKYLARQTSANCTSCKARSRHVVPSLPESTAFAKVCLKAALPAELALCGYDVAGRPSIQLSLFRGEGLRYGVRQTPSPCAACPARCSVTCWCCADAPAPAVQCATLTAQPRALAAP